MPSESSVSQSPKFQAGVALAWMADAGQLDALPCPECHDSSVSVWFTHPAENEYRTWFICEKCGFQTRARNEGRPAHYSEARDRTSREEGERLKPEPVSPATRS